MQKHQGKEQGYLTEPTNHDSAISAAAIFLMIFCALGISYAVHENSQEIVPVVLPTPTSEVTRLRTPVLPTVVPTTDPYINNALLCSGPNGALNPVCTSPVFNPYGTMPGSLLAPGQ